MRRAQQALGHAFKPASAQALLSPSLCGGMQRISVCNGPAASPLWLLRALASYMQPNSRPRCCAVPSTLGCDL